MSFISALMKVEVKNELNSLLDKQVANLKKLLSANLSKRSVNLVLSLKSASLKIEFTELGIKEKDSILELPFDKAFSESFETAESEKDPVSGIFESAELDFVLKGTCKIDKVKFEKKFMGAGVRVNNVSFDYEFTVHAAEKPC